MPFAPVIPFNPLTSPIGERPGFPTFLSSPGGGTTVKRELVCLQQDVMNWFTYFQLNPIDPYTFNGNLWTFEQHPFERQKRVQGDPAIFGPAYAIYQLSLLSLTYESKGMKYYPGQGLVKEEYKPRLQVEPVGVLRTDYNASAKNLTWESNDADGSNKLFYSEHPHMEWGGGELYITFPFAPTNSVPLSSGTVNTNPFTSLVLGRTFVKGTLKFIEASVEASVVIPAIGAVTGAVRYNKTYLFHLRQQDWNYFWRARDQQFLRMKDASGAFYYQYPYDDFNSYNLFA